MAKILFKKTLKKRMCVLGLSTDWDTLTPWEHKGKNMPYFGIHKSISASGNVKFTYLFIGPFGVVIGKWIG